MVVNKRQATENNLDRIKHAIKGLNGTAPSRSRIWRSLRGAKTSKKSQMFSWRNSRRMTSPREWKGEDISPWALIAEFDGTHTA
ncbi:hypothetical protein CPB85DRAFT_1240698 [Mucidula mucida]|nr:hypothetical protein CPB85DRAFT_1240698 [Mucidula mucida]